jgi:hypothetical protein
MSRAKSLKLVRNPGPNNGKRIPLRARDQEAPEAQAASSNAGSRTRRDPLKLRRVKGVLLEVVMPQKVYQITPEQTHICNSPK